MVTILLQKILDLLKAKLGLINTTPETASGSEVVFVTDMELPLDVLKATITATQEAGTPTPASPKAITGYDSVVITQKDETDTTVDTFTIDLGETIYGGVLDCKNGTKTITHNIYTIDGEENWTIEDTHIFSANIFARKFGDDVQSLCDEMTFWGNGTTTQLRNGLEDGQFGFVRSNNRIWVRFDDCSTVAEIQAKTEGMTILYETQTSTELSGLTPANITTIKGTNKLSANCGDLEVEYRVSTKSLITYKDLTADLTINTQCIDSQTADIRAYQQGHLVYVQIQNLKYTVMPEDTTVIVTGLPKPKLATNAAVADGYDLERCIRFRVNTDGELQQWYCRPAGNHYAVGQIVYITDEV